MNEESVDNIGRDYKESELVEIPSKCLGSSENNLSHKEGDVLITASITASQIL